VIPDGESFKSWPTLHDVLTRLLEINAERSTTLVALGGGVVGDLCGFAAAIYQRGMPFVQVPTTLLAQVDSSVGGKTAINHPLGKNMIGAFHQPRAVVIDTIACAPCLSVNFAAGLAEVIKTAASPQRMRSFDGSRRICRALSRLMPTPRARGGRKLPDQGGDRRADEREAGERALLNFGHTFGHAIETGVGLTANGCTARRWPRA
jgi:3-dehydroquinate synthase